MNLLSKIFPNRDKKRDKIAFQVCTFGASREESKGMYEANKQKTTNENNNNDRCPCGDIFAGDFFIRNSSRIYALRDSTIHTVSGNLSPSTPDQYILALAQGN